MPVLPDWNTTSASWVDAISLSRRSRGSHVRALAERDLADLEPARRAGRRQRGRRDPVGGDHLGRLRRKGLGLVRVFGPLGLGQQLADPLDHRGGRGSRGVGQVHGALRATRATSGRWSDSAAKAGNGSTMTSAELTIHPSGVKTTSSRCVGGRP